MSNINKEEYRSLVYWPKDKISLGNSDNMSIDTHITKEQAIAVCKSIEKRGFGGEGKIFPLKTEVETISDYPLY